MGIEFKHKEYEAHEDQWKLIDRVCSGDEVDEYLIELNPLDKSRENVSRNKAYKDRAVFYPIAGRTAQGLNSLLFSSKPKMNVPAELEYLSNNADGKGVSIYQQARDVALDVIKTARSGLFVTYPKTEGPLSKADMESGSYFATIHEYEADQILNWRNITVGSKVVLGLVVLSECVEEVQGDGYEVKDVEQLRELALVNGVFIERTWRKNEKQEWVQHSEYVPTDGAGNPWDMIPFTFVGSESNSADVDDSIMLGLSKLNVAHYRNSADFEDSCWFVGQAQPWMSGVNQTHVDMMKQNSMYVGSRSLLGVPSGETFGYASADPNPLVRQAMSDKVDAMVGLGARYIQPGGVAKTATESDNDAAVQHSALSMISANVSEAYSQCIQWAAKYMNAQATETNAFETNMDFVNPTATAQEIQAMVAGFIQGAIPIGDYFEWLKKVDIADKEKTLDEFTSDIGNSGMPDLGSTA